MQLPSLSSGCEIAQFLFAVLLAHTALIHALQSGTPITTASLCERRKHRHAIIILWVRQQTHRHAIILMLSSSCEFDNKHIDDMPSSSSCYHHLVSSTDTSACYHHLAIIILWVRQTHRHAIIISWVRQTHRHAINHLVSSTDTSICGGHAIIIFIFGSHATSHDDSMTHLCRKSQYDDDMMLMCSTPRTRISQSVVFKGVRVDISRW